jgi:SAM-dependent methyltransferase
VCDSAASAATTAFTAPTTLDLDLEAGVHPSAHAQMKLSIQRYMEKDRKYRVLDFGSGTSPRQTLTHRSLLAEYDCDYTGVDVRKGNNIDIVMKKPYRIPLRSKSVDIVVSGQVFEHVPFFWASLLEIARVMKPHAYFFLTVPSRGHMHSTYDCWRIYPDGLRSMAAWSRLRLREGFTDFPPPIGDAGLPRKKHDFAEIDSENYYWGDTVGVFQKPADYPTLRAAVLRGAVLPWVNRIENLEGVPKPKADPRGVAERSPARRKDVLGVRERQP